MEKTPTPKLDLAQLSESFGNNVSISIEPEEHPDERNSRLRHEARQFALAQFWTGVVVLVFLALIGWALSNVRDPDHDLAIFARGLVLTLVASMVSFIAGRLSAK